MLPNLDLYYKSPCQRLVLVTGCLYELDLSTDDFDFQLLNIASLEQAMSILEGWVSRKLFSTKICVCVCVCVFSH